mmetsp:Transcript_35424/g.67803  ORF Transcript_35424/g.67803 Transcript_35424/m.67803 type:complete len:235 (-) Transcript_35424:322-1026(-)|eukprot:CAMPEP_0114253604 /NCGR_PEP_ID=MMETSP0058-20121206/16483_1 /TAXON_ID=36894 /ORGANISM="Pyramimonas parkeae, CCMP726" /LENGTH=234 /DNA_ID=CAMNT_0001367665 /DNA_START=70 /DNA_END=774 /DNA_ORIENTATION=+
MAARTFLHRGLWLLILSASTSFLQSGATGSLEPIVLSDADFEHQTQAATGQTTGVWFVSMGPAWCSRCQRLESVWLQLADAASEQNPSFLVAHVDTESSPRTSRRFTRANLLVASPQLLLFRDRQVYVYKGPWEVEELVEFVHTGYKEVDAHNVPPEASMMEEYFHQALGPVKLLVDSVGRSSDPFFAGALLCLGVGTVLAVVAVTIHSLFAKPKAVTSKKKSKSQGKPKPKSG